MPRIRSLFVYPLLFLGYTIFGQISPPGLDEAHDAIWTAVGISQKLSNQWSVGFYVGAARKSDPDNFSLLKKPAIFVLNEELTLRINKKWSTSFCASYRRQNEYSSEPPYRTDEPDAKTEDRFYMRLYYRDTVAQTGVVFSFRPELRFYYGEHGHTWDPVDEEIRLRFKGQTAIRLGHSDSNQLIFGNEILTTTDHEKDKSQDHWTAYNFSEDRITTYLRHKFSPMVTADIGVMHQIKKHGDYIAHLSFDLIFNDVFSRRKL